MAELHGVDHASGRWKKVKNQEGMLGLPEQCYIDGVDGVLGFNLVNLLEALRFRSEASS